MNTAAQKHAVKLRKSGKNRTSFRKRLSAFLFLIPALVFAVSCHGDSTPSEDGLDNSKSEEIITMSRSFTNSVSRGDEIFNAVMEKYRPVLDFYGSPADCEEGELTENDFKTLVKLYLGYDEDSDFSDSASYNYNYLKAIVDSDSDAEIILYYEDGTKETLPAAELLNEETHSLNWGKIEKAAGFGAKLEDYDKMIDKLQDSIKNYKPDYFLTLIYGDDLKESLSELSELAGKLNDSKILNGILSSLGGICGKIGTVISAAKFLGIIKPGQDATQRKLNHIIKLLEGIYKHLEYIEAKLDCISIKIDTNEYRERVTALKNLKSEINGAIQNMSITDEGEAAKLNIQLANFYINGWLGRLNDASLDEYDYFKNCVKNYSSSEQKTEGYRAYSAYLKPWDVRFEIPYQISWKYYSEWEEWEWPEIIHVCSGMIDGEPITGYADYFNNSLKNSNEELPFFTDNIEYISSIYRFAMSLNEYILSQEELEDANSNRAEIYLTTKNQYIDVLRTKIIESFMDYKDSEDSLKFSQTASDSFNGGDLSIIQGGRQKSDPSWKAHVNRHLGKTLSNGYTSYSSGSNDFYPYDYPTAGYSGTQFPVTIRYTYRSGFGVHSPKARPRLHFGSEYDAFPVFNLEWSGYGISWRLNKGKIERNVWTEASFSSDSFSDLTASAESAFRKRSKEKTADNLMCFAACLAALEIQMAAYLDDDAFEAYKNSGTAE